MRLLLKIFILNYITSISRGVLQIKPASDEEVLHLIGEPDFRDVALRWEYEFPKSEHTTPNQLYGFQIHYCEMQAWGPRRCRTKAIEKNESGHRQGRSSKGWMTRISGLRMATTYSFEVRPIRDVLDMADVTSIGKSIIVPTKGFSAKATQCLPHASEVEVSTGPYFGGRISVEASDGGPERCGLQGSPNSAQDTYTIRIDHEQCGSEVNDTTVATYIIVQENLPILTHSTRRFLVLCSYKPETLTVRAGINLPNSTQDDPQISSSTRTGSVEPYDLQNLEYNDVQTARLQGLSESNESIGAEIALVVFLVMAAFGGLALLAWKMVPRGSRDNISINTTSSLRSSLFSRLARYNRDMFSDKVSVYSIDLSEKDDKINKTNDCDNCSEA